MNNHNSSSGSIHTCKVRLFRDEESLVVNFQKQVTGEWLLNYVCSQLNLVEKYYFGLRYTDKHSGRHWLDLSVPVLKQVKDPAKDEICFRIRYYPASPELLKEDLTRYQLYMQLRRDAFHGRLVPRPTDVPILSALIMQSELGDFEDHELDSGFTKDIELLPKLASTTEDKILQCYKELSGLSASDAETRFIDVVKSLESYGIDQQSVKDKAGQQFHIGANYNGVSLFQSFRRTKLIKWEFMVKCTVDGKTVSVAVLYPEVDEKAQKQVHKYKCSDEQTANFLWTNILDQQAFFTLHSRDQAKSVRSGGLFSKSKKYKFSGRCYDEVVDDSRKILRLAPEFVRASSLSLNRSQSIRTSKRPSNTLRKRNSLGNVPHSQSLPIDFNGDSLNDTTSSLNALEGGDTPPSTPVHSKDTNSITDTLGEDLSGMSLTQTMNLARSADEVPATTSSQSNGVEQKTVTVAEVTVPAEPTLFASTPVSMVSGSASVELETTPVYQTKSDPDSHGVIELEVNPAVEASISQGPTRFPPTITVTEAVDASEDQIPCRLADGESEEEYTLTSASEESADDEDGHFEPIDGVASVDTAEQKDDLVESHGKENGSVLTEVVEEVMSESRTDDLESAPKLNSSATGSELKLDLDKLADDSSAESASDNGGSSTKPPSRVKPLSMVIVPTVLALAVGVFIATQSDPSYLDAIRQMDPFQQLHQFLGRYL